jgi:hypothetical protein
MDMQLATMYALKDSVNAADGAIRADIYFADARGLPGPIVAQDIDENGEGFVLVLWVESDDADETLDADTLIGNHTLNALLDLGGNDVKTDYAITSNIPYYPGPWR